MNQVVVKQEKSGYQIVEAYKSLRTNLQFCGEDKKVIAVTSCTPNEGKSSVSMQLGISLAESGDFDRCRSSEIGSSWKNENTEICSRTGTLPVRSGNSGGCHLFYQCKELLHDLFRPVSAESGRASGGKELPKSFKCTS